jgi:hypothetical protein
MNILRDPSNKLVIYYLSDSYKITNIIAIIDYTFYRLCDFSAIWFKDFTKILVGLGMKPCSNELYIFISKDYKVLVLFFVDDI